MGEYKPDGIVFLDISVEEGIKRNRNNNNDEHDPFDTLGVEYFQKVVEGYREMARNNWSGVPWFVVDGERSLQIVTQDVQEVLREILGMKVKNEGAR